MNMRIHSLRPNFVLAAACLLALLLFALDSVLSQAHLWGSFLLPIVVAFLWGRRRDIFIVTAFASVLVVAEYRLANVVLHERDLLAEPFAPQAFDAIVAADVLEHFSDTAPIASRLFEWLRDDGVLVTSLPSENWIYVLLRRVFDIEKPPDHYFTGAEVEASLGRAGFRPLARRTIPIGIPGTGLFLVTAWRKAV